MSKKNKFIFDPEKAALIIIDLQNHFSHPEGRAFLSSSIKILPNILMLSEIFHSKKIPVIATRHSHKAEDDLGMMGKFYNDYIRSNEWDSLLVKEINKNDNIKIIDKNTYDAFWKTDLEEYLTVKGIKQLVITGCMTHLCCETTARSAFIRGFEVYFINDATFTKNDALHSNTLHNIEDGFGVIMSTEEIIRACQKTI
ncbi:MAG: isochorismatase family protein [bacterium]